MIKVFLRWCGVAAVMFLVMGCGLWELLFPDTVPPVPGGSGTIVTGTVTESSVQLSWTAATDDETATASLRYLVVYSTADNVGTVAQALENGEEFGDWTSAMTTVTVTGLSPETLYYFNVLVRDESDNKAAYTRKAATTEAVGPSAEEAAAAAVLVMTSAWDATAHLRGGGEAPPAGIVVDASDLEFPIGGSVIIEFSGYAPPGTDVTISGTVTCTMAWHLDSEPNWFETHWSGTLVFTGLGVETCVIDAAWNVEMWDWSTATWAGTIVVDGVEADLDAVMAEYIAHIIATTPDTGDEVEEEAVKALVQAIRSAVIDTHDSATSSTDENGIFTYTSEDGSYSYAIDLMSAGDPSEPCVFETFIDYALSVDGYVVNGMLSATVEFGPEPGTVYSVYTGTLTLTGGAIEELVFAWEYEAAVPDGYYATEITIAGTVSANGQVFDVAGWDLGPIEVESQNIIMGLIQGDPGP